MNFALQKLQIEARFGREKLVLYERILGRYVAWWERATFQCLETMPFQLYSRKMTEMMMAQCIDASHFAIFRTRDL